MDSAIIKFFQFITTESNSSCDRVVQNYDPFGWYWESAYGAGQAVYALVETKNSNARIASARTGQDGRTEYWGSEQIKATFVLKPPILVKPLESML